MGRLSFSIIGITLAVTAVALPHLGNPLGIPIQLSANFAELRPDHFHSGLDFKTEGRCGLPVYSAADGYVSGVEVGPWGFGRAVYVTHPQLGLVTVYGHLESFSPEVDKVVRDEQYRRESFDIEMEFPAGQFPVSKGQEIGRSGNAGGSGGPHLHFNVHDLSTGDALDPLPYYRDRIKDTEPPYCKELYLFGEPGRGVVESRSGETFTAWGQVYPAIKANDAMDGQSNIYGVKKITLWVDGHLVWGRNLDRFTYASTRAINTLVDYPTLMDGRGWAEWTRVPASRPLSYLVGAGLSNGALIIDEEREYRCRYELEDGTGNRKSVTFTIRGKRPQKPYKQPTGTLFRWKGHNTWSLRGAFLDIPARAAYDDFRLTFREDSVVNSRFVSPVYVMEGREVPFAEPFTLTLDAPKGVSKVCMVRVDGERVIPVDFIYQDGKVTANLRRFGRYALMKDETAPSVRLEECSDGYISLIFDDNLSGIERYRATIDGRFALFEYDAKNDRLWFRMDPTRFARGSHRLEVSVSDPCLNTKILRHDFTW